MRIFEKNLALSAVEPGDYELIALPMKLEGLGCGLTNPDIRCCAGTGRFVPAPPSLNNKADVAKTKKNDRFGGGRRGA
ncbi:hypothetical protein QW131_28365 [Roseibium salinum]|nr:hypothetical protein [Roseibium salinum]